MEPLHFNNTTMSEINLAVTGWEEVQMTEDTFIEEVKTYITFRIANLINLYWFPILVPLGLVGNTLSFTVMIQPKNRKVSTCIYMAAISINDNLMMCLCFHDYLVAGLEIHEWYPIECKCSAFVALFALQNCTYLILAMTIDKYIAIKWPHRAATYSTPGKAKSIAVGLYVSVFIYNIPHFILSLAIGGQCFAYAVDKLITKVYSWFSFVINVIIPFTLLIHMNFVIVKTVRNSHKMQGSSGVATRQAAMKSTEKQLTIMMLLVTTLFLILLCPTYIRFIYLTFSGRDTPFQYANSMLLYQITFKLYTTNSGINFLLYCISGQKFRNDLKEILCSSSKTESLSELSLSIRSETCFVHTNASGSIPMK